MSRLSTSWCGSRPGAAQNSRRALRHLLFLEPKACTRRDARSSARVVRTISQPVEEIRCRRPCNRYSPRASIGYPSRRRLLQPAVIGKDVPLALRGVAGLGEDELRRGLGHLQAAEFLYETSLFPDLSTRSASRLRTM